MNILFIKESLSFPRAAGHDVHGYNMMKALFEQGNSISLLTEEKINQKAIEGLSLNEQYTFSELPAELGEVKGLSYLETKFIGYWGVSHENIMRAASIVNRNNYDAVVVVGLEVLPYLAAIKGCARVWYAADEWCLHHLSQIRLFRLQSWRNIREALIKALYEYAFSMRVDVNWVVSEKDANAIRLVMPRSEACTIPNGVDADYYSPLYRTPIAEKVKIGRSIVFWGRLDFGPNIDAVRWFSENVWSSLKERVPNLSWTVFGFSPCEDVVLLSKNHGFNLLANVEDLVSEVDKHDIVVVPFVSGAGIKNKLLEACSMGKVVVASPLALNGTMMQKNGICITASSGKDWCDKLEQLLANPEQAGLMGARSRAWVIEHHSWKSAAKKAIASLSVIRD